MYEMIHVVQPFDRQPLGLIPRQARQFKSGELAARSAELIAQAHAGVVAYSMQVGEDGGDYGEPVVLASFGEVPELA